jgi:hypothetical protein
MYSSLCFVRLVWISDCIVIIGLEKNVYTHLGAHEEAEILISTAVSSALE